LNNNKNSPSTLLIVTVHMLNNFLIALIQEQTPLEQAMTINRTSCKKRLIKNYLKMIISYLTRMTLK
jgi:hypothetical protein